MKKMIKDAEFDLWWGSLSDSYSMHMTDIYRQVGSTRAIYEMDKKELIQIKGISEEAANYIIYRRNRWNYSQMQTLLTEKKLRFIPWYDDEYPKKLLQIAYYPFALFVRGELPDEKKPAVAIIGSRECSEYGRGVATYFGEQLAMHNVNIISGMAIGIDGISQQAAIRAGGLSYAVLGSGADVCYPPANKALYERLQKNGGIISEYSPGAKAIAWHFPRRNRIISALCDVLLVVEAGHKSGTLITADCALEQGKDVAIVPGRITDPMSVGCMDLMKEGAVPVTNVDDLLEMMSEKCMLQPINVSKSPGEIANENKIPLETEEKLVYSCLDLYPKSTDEIYQKAGIEYRQLLCILSTLEMKGYVLEVSKDYFVAAGV